MPPSFGAPTPKKKSDNTWIWIVAGLGCVGMLGVGVLVVGIGALVAYRASQEADAYEQLYGANDYDPYGAYGADPYADPYAADPYAAPTVDPLADPLGGLGAAGFGAEPLPAEPIRFVPIDDSPSQGPADALVTIVAFSDYQCPFCSRADATLAQIRENYGADVRIVYKHNPLPFHQDAMPAAELALEARAQRGDEGFLEAHAVLYQNQHTLSRADLERISSGLSLDIQGTRRALDDHRHQAAIQRDADLAARIGATGTPTFFVNGAELRGAQPYEEFARVIDQQRLAANLLVASGIPRAQVYDTVMRDAVR
jgi:protein-disulfide isomerase